MLNDLIKKAVYAAGPPDWLMCYFLTILHLYHCPSGMTYIGVEEFRAG